METVKLSFHLELYVTLVSNLNSGLGLELQVFCESSFTQSLDRYLATVGLPAGGAYVSYSKTFHEFTRENPTLIDCDI